MREIVQILVITQSFILCNSTFIGHLVSEHEIIELAALWTFWHLHLAFKDTGILIQSIWSFVHLAWFYQPLEFQSLGNWRDKALKNVQHTCTNFMYAYHLQNIKQDCYTECRWISLLYLSMFLLCNIYGGILQNR